MERIGRTKKTSVYRFPKKTNQGKTLYYKSLDAFGTGPSKKYLETIDPFPEDQQSIDRLHTKFLGRKGLISSLFSSLPSVDKKDLPILGKELNQLKNELSSIFNDKIKVQSDKFLNELFRSASIKQNE